MIHTLENNYFKIEISTKGAELQSIFSKKLGVELLWQGDASFWGKRSPILFPIVGSLKNGTYEYEGKNYALTRHGFARDMEFECITENDTTTLSFFITHNNDTLKIYPFEFKFVITYTLQNDKLHVTPKVINTSESKNLYTSFGAHPAFNLPIFNTTRFEEYSLVFSEDEVAGVYPLTNDGLIMENEIPFFSNSNQLNLTKELFYKDALVFKNLKSSSIKLLHNQFAKGFEFGYTNGFKYFGIWSAKNAPFVCLEPWAGIADVEHANGSLIDKEGILKISPKAEIEETWSISAIDN